MVPVVKPAIELAAEETSVLGTLQVVELVYLSRERIEGRSIIELPSTSARAG